jgi:hypothetical protein
MILSVLCVFPCHATEITSISYISDQQIQTIVISGSGFGDEFAFATPYSGLSYYMSFTDITQDWQAGNQYNFNLVTVIIESWTDTSIVLGGFSGQYGFYTGGYKNNWYLRDGDHIEIDVNNSPNFQGSASGFAVVGQESSGPSDTPEPSDLLLVGTGIIGLAFLATSKRSFHSQ